MSSPTLLIHNINLKKFYFFYVFFFFNFISLFNDLFFKFFNKINLTRLNKKKIKIFFKKKYKIKKNNSLFSLNLKSFFFLKNLKKKNDSVVFLSSKNRTQPFNFIINFKFNFFLKKKNPINFVGSSFFKNYFKFSFFNKKILFKYLKIKKKIQTWKLKKIFFLIKKKKKVLNLCFFKKLSYFYFFFKNEIVKKNKNNTLKLKTLIGAYRKNESHFSFLPIKYFFLKKNIYQKLSKNLLKVRLKKKIKKFNLKDKRLKIINKSKNSYFSKKKKLSFINLNLFKNYNFYFKNQLFQAIKWNQKIIFSSILFYNNIFFSKKKSFHLVLNYRIKLKKKLKVKKFLINFFRIKKNNFFLKKNFKIGFLKKNKLRQVLPFLFWKKNLKFFPQNKIRRTPTRFKVFLKKNFFLKKKKTINFFKFFRRSALNRSAIITYKPFRFFFKKQTLNRYFKFFLSFKKIKERLFLPKFFFLKKKIKFLFYKNLIKNTFTKKNIILKKKKINLKKKIVNYAKNHIRLINKKIFFSFFFYSKKNKNVVNPQYYFFENFFSLPVLISKVRYFFYHTFSGFIYLDSSSWLSLYQKNNILLVKKLIYSFASKNDLQNFILKKYIKTTYFSMGEKSLEGFENDLTFLPKPEFYFFKTLFDSKDEDDCFETEQKSQHELLHTQDVFFFKSTYWTSKLNNDFLKKKFTDLTGSNPYSLKWSELILQPFYIKILAETNHSFSIKKTKFKPGYPNMWRSYRATLKTLLGLKFKYQHQLTKYLLKFNKMIRNDLHFFFEMQLDNVLTLSKIFPDRNWSLFFISEGLIFINGVKFYSSFDQLFKNDFIQLIVSNKYYILYRWLTHWQFVKKNRLKNRFYKKLNNRSLPDDKQKSKNLPLWILKNKNLNEDVVKHLEVDYFSLSFFVLYEPVYFFDINPLSFLSMRFNIINLFNWKYIN